MSLAKRLTRVLGQWTRRAEQLLIGASSMAASATSDVVDEPGQVPILQKRVVKELHVLFGLQLAWPVLVELRLPPPAGWRAGFYNPEGNLGRYTLVHLGQLATHQILIRPGMSQARFCALLAHELVHAYQREKNILVENQALREGMARWVEFHFLKDRDPAESEKLLALKHYTFGKSIESILAYEKQHGRDQTLHWLVKQ